MRVHELMSQYVVMHYTHSCSQQQIGGLLKDVFASKEVCFI